MQLASGTNLQNGKYKIIRVLGQGGFGITYLAEHTLLDKMVAIKEFFPKEYCDRDEMTSHITIGTKNSVELVSQLKGKFIKEAKNISKLHHHNIITIHDIFQENDTAYYVMEYVDGYSLSEFVKQNGPIPETEALTCIRKIGDAVGYMHSMSMNHLDLKPANIMVRQFDGEPILIDFGLSKQYDASGGQTSTSPVGISHGFAPIEQYHPAGVSTFTPQTDVYALGATIYALIKGENPPHYSDILEEGLPDLPTSTSKETVSAIKKAMEIKKAKRPASVEEFLAMLPNTVDYLNRISSGSKHVPLIQEHVLVNERKDKKLMGEETVILNVPLQTNQPPRKDLPPKEAVEPNFDNSSDYLDLGLSVKWAVRLSGKAIPLINGEKEVYSFELENGKTISPSEFIAIGNSLPTIKHFEELLERCSWTTFSQDGLNGYKITGPNGNILMMPLGILNRYLSQESLKPNRLYYYFLYLGEYTHTLAKGVPTETNIWTIKK